MADLDALQPIANRLIDQYFKSGLASLEPRDRVFFLIWAYGADLGNGGHSAFFYNSEADNYPETVEALEQVGLTGFADLLRSAAFLLFRGEVPRTIEARNAILDDMPDDAVALEENISSLDDEFFATGGDDKALDSLEHWYRSPQQ